ncbi:MAG: hypothetical protein JXB30_09200 [Anaerolineae bacterium]|nr:hypothetical protein [Anaerolineae bacterium]
MLKEYIARAQLLFNGATNPTVKTAAIQDKTDTPHNTKALHITVRKTSDTPPSKEVDDLKSFVARQIIDYLKKRSSKVPDLRFHAPCGSGNAPHFWRNPLQ